MRNKSAVLTLLVLTGMLFADSPAAQAQQPIKDDSGNTALITKCRLPVVVTGEVRNPIRFELQQNLRLLDALGLAGGFNEQAGRTIRIDHPTTVPGCNKVNANDSSARVESFEIYPLADVLNEKSNPFLTPGDVVTLSTAERAIVIGSVVWPNILFLRDPLTVSRAIAMAGGTLPGSKKERISITRRAFGEKNQTVITVNLKAIEKRRAQDILLQPNDILFVPGKELRYCCAAPNLQVTPPQHKVRIIY